MESQPEQFPFAELPPEIQEMIASQRAAYPRLSRVATRFQEFRQNPYVARELCTAPVSPKEINDLIDWYLNAYGEVLFFQIKPTFRTFVVREENPNCMNTPYEVLVTTYLAQPEEETHGKGHQELFKYKTMSSLFETLYAGETETYIEPRFWYYLLNRRSVCSLNLPDYAVNGVLANFDETAQMVLQSVKDYAVVSKRRIIITYLNIFLEVLGIEHYTNDLLDLNDDEFIDFVNKQFELLQRFLPGALVDPVPRGRIIGWEQ